MSAVEGSLDSLGRTHVVLAIASVAVLLLAVPTGPDFEAGLTQLRALDEVLGDDGYGLRCAELAARQYAAMFGAAREYRGQTPTTAFPPRMRFGGDATCPNLPRDPTLKDAATFLVTPERVEYERFDAEELLAALRRAGARGGRVMGAWVLHPPGIPQGSMRSVVVGTDTIDVQVNPPNPHPPQWKAGDSMALRVARTSSIGNVPMGGSPGAAGDSTTPLDWLRGTRWGFRALADSVQGEMVVLPALQPFWSEISGLPTSEAIRYLQARADDERGSVEILGMAVDTSLIVWGGPLILIVLLGYLLVHLQHLERIAHEDLDTLRSYPWIALFPGVLSVLLWAASVAALPTLACIAVVARSLPASRLGTAWAALGAIGCLAFGTAILMLVRRLRLMTTSHG